MCLGIKNRLLIFISIIFCSYYLRHFTPPRFFFHNSFCELLTQIFSFYFFLDDYNDKQNTFCVYASCVLIYSKSLVNKLVINSFAILTSKQSSVCVFLCETVGCRQWYEIWEAHYIWHTHVSASQGKEESYEKFIRVIRATFFLCWWLTLFVLEGKYFRLWVFLFVPCCS